MQGMSQPPKKKRGILSKIFGRKKKDNASFCSPALPVPEDLPTPTVVILNSLNHNQLLELLRVPPCTIACPPAVLTSKGLTSYPSGCSSDLMPVQSLGFYEYRDLPSLRQFRTAFTMQPSRSQLKLIRDATFKWTFSLK